VKVGWNGFSLGLVFLCGAVSAALALVVDLATTASRFT
jgi:hypothetical protein